MYVFLLNWIIPYVFGTLLVEYYATILSQYGNSRAVSAGDIVLVSSVLVAIASTWILRRVDLVFKRGNSGTASAKTILQFQAIIASTCAFFMLAVYLSLPSWQFRVWDLSNQQQLPAMRRFYANKDLLP